MPQNSNFRLPRGHRFFATNGSYGYGAKSRWGSRGVYLGANGVPLGKKNGSKPYKITMPQNSNFRLPRDHRFFPKNGSYGYGTKSRWGLPRVHHGANGYHWVQKIGQKRRKLPCPKIRIFDKPAVIDFLQKMEVTVMVPNHGRDPVSSILGPMGSHWVKKMGQNRKKITMPQNSNIRLPRGHRFFAKNGSYGYGAKSKSMGSHWVQKMGQNQWGFSTTPRIFPKKWKLPRQITVGTL